MSRGGTLRVPHLRAASVALVALVACPQERRVVPRDLGDSCGVRTDVVVCPPSCDPSANNSLRSYSCGSGRLLPLDRGKPPALRRSTKPLVRYQGRIRAVSRTTGQEDSHEPSRARKAEAEAEKS